MWFGAAAVAVFVSLAAATDPSVTVTGAAQSHGLPGPFGSPSTTTTVTFMSHGAMAWADLTGSEFRNPHPLVTGVPTTVPSGVLLSGSTVAFSCPAGQGYPGCDAWVHFYHCPQSCSPEFQAGMTSELVANDWRFTVCSAQFVNGASAYVHGMRAYHKVVPAGTTETVTTTADAEFLAFGINSVDVLCSSLLSQVPCEAVSGDRCVWDAGECKATRCKNPGQGPPPPCLECAWQPFVVRPGKGPGL